MSNFWSTLLLVPLFVGSFLLFSTITALLFSEAITAPKNLHKPTHGKKGKFRPKPETSRDERIFLLPTTSQKMRSLTTNYSSHAWIPKYTPGPLGPSLFLKRFFERRADTTKKNAF